MVPHGMPTVQHSDLRLRKRVDEAEFQIVRHIRHAHGAPEVQIAKELLAEDNERYIKVDRQALRPILPAGQTTAKMMWFICCPNNDRCHPKITKKGDKRLSVRRIMLYASI